MTFRSEAHEALQRANAELASGSDDRLRYAALELRMAMEAITYDRAAAYKDDFPKGEYATWQPKKVLSVLLDLDPAADKSATVSLGPESVPGQPATEMHLLGTDTPLNKATIKQHYDALGSYLHFPTLKQYEAKGIADFGRLRTRCVQIASHLQDVLESPIWNAIFSHISHTNCKRCGKSVRCRLAFNDEIGKEREVHCRHCDAPYIAINLSAQQVRFKPLETEILCQSDGCGVVSYLWNDRIKAGNVFKCWACGARHEICLGINLVQADDNNAD